jgi:hypothetical protein
MNRAEGPSTSILGAFYGLASSSGAGLLDLLGPGRLIVGSTPEGWSSIPDGRQRDRVVAPLADPTWQPSG